MRLVHEERAVGGQQGVVRQGVEVHERITVACDGKSSVLELGEAVQLNAAITPRFWLLGRF